MERDLRAANTRVARLEKRDGQARRAVRSLRQVLCAALDAGVLSAGAGRVTVPGGEPQPWAVDATSLAASHKALAQISKYVEHAYRTMRGLEGDKEGEGGMGGTSRGRGTLDGGVRVLRTNGTVDVSVFPCEHCKKRFVSFDALLSHHSRRHHGLAPPSMPAAAGSSRREGLAGRGGEGSSSLEDFLDQMRSLLDGARGGAGGTASRRRAAVLDSCQRQTHVGQQALVPPPPSPHRRMNSF